MNTNALPSDKIRASISISAYLRKHFPHIKLNGSRKQYRCACPIHGGNNKTTFAVDDEKGTWKCFSGCGSGSIIDLWLALNKRPQSDIIPAMEALSEEAGISIALNENSSHSLSRARLASVVEEVCTSAHKLLTAQQSASTREAMEYLESRSLYSEDIEEWKIGFLPGKKDVAEFLINAAKKAVGSRAKEALTELSILEKSQYGKDELFSQFAHRIIFPIRDKTGRFVGISARILPSDDKNSKQKKSKYVNSRASELFDKSTVMFGEHNAVRHGKNQTKHVLVCEGQMDVISLSFVLEDDEIAVATCGTALTEDHMSWLSTFEHVSMVFDGDEAGTKAMVKSVPIINHIGSKNVDSIIFKSGKDANDIILNKGEDGLIDELDDNVLPLIDGASRALWLQSNENIEEFYSLSRPIVESIRRKIERQRFISCMSRESGITENDIARELSMSLSAKRTRKSSSRQSDNSSVSKSLENVCIWLAHLDTKTRSALLMDMDIWLKNDFVSESLLNVQNATDRSILYYLSYGDNMTKKNKKYKKEDVDHISLIATNLVGKDIPDPNVYFVRMARVLLNEIRLGNVDKVHMSFLRRLVAQKHSEEAPIIFSNLGQIISESFN